jgi:hypothetical protein
MEMETNRQNRYLKLPAEAAERLLALKGSSSWEEFINQVEPLLKHKDAPMLFYFKKNLAEMNLSEGEVCHICKKHSVHPQILQKLNYLDIVYNYASSMGIKVSQEVLQQRFVEAGYESEMLGCPYCHALGGNVPFDIMLHELLPELTILSLQCAYQINKCNTAPH